MTEEKINKSKWFSFAWIKNVLVGGVLSSKQVTRQIPFVIFLAALSIGLITNKYITQKTIRQIEIVRDSLKEIKSESVIHETELMYINRPSEVSRRVIERKIDLIEPVDPPKRIKVKKMEKK